jgi:hypothetical protein
MKELNENQFTANVYKITNNIDDRFYIGSTKRKLASRLAEHKHNSSNELRRSYNAKVYVCMRELGVDNFKIELICKCLCDSKDDLHKKEQEYINLLKPTLNVLTAHHTKETKKQVVVNYEKNNREYIRERDRDKLKKYAIEHKEELINYKAEYYLKNKIKCDEKTKVNYIKNKDKITEHNKQKIECECGSIINQGGKAKHRRSQKHLDAMK